MKKVSKTMNNFFESKPNSILTFTEHKWKDQTKLYLSPGCNILLTECNASWLFNFIAKQQTHPTIYKYSFQVWTFEQLKNLSWIIYTTDGARHLLFSESIFQTNFPLRTCQLWYIEGHIFLPRELKCPTIK